MNSGAPTTQNFNTIGATATAALPANWKADKQTVSRTLGTYAAAVSATEQLAGENMSGTAANGIYNYGSPTAAAGGDRAVGFISSASATKSGNLYAYLRNTSPSALSSVTVSFDVEKYRDGSNPAGYLVQMYYSTNGSTWTSAGPAFLVAFAAGAGNTGFASPPGATTSITDQTLAISIPSNGDLYLAFDYSVQTGTTTSNAIGLGIDNFSIYGTVVAGDTTPPTVQSVAVVDGTHVDVTFDEPMGTGVTTAANYTLSGTGKGTLATNPSSAALQSGNTYRLTWASGEMVNGGDITVTVANSQDIAGNTIGAPISGTATGAGIGTAPTIQTRVPANGTAINGLASVQVTFSESVSGVAAGALTVGGSAATGISGTGAGPYTFSGFTSPTGSGSIPVVLTGAGITDLAGNPFATGNWSYTQNDSPVSVLLTSGNVASGNATNISPVSFTATFSEAVTGFVLGDIAVTSGTAANFVSVNALTYTFDVTTTATAVSVVIPAATATATAVPNNPNSASNTYSYTFDGVAPQIVSVSSVSGQNSTVRITFDGPVTGATVPGNYTITQDVAPGLGTIPSGSSPDTAVAIGGNAFDLTFSGVLGESGSVNITVSGIADAAGNLVSPNFSSGIVPVELSQFNVD